MSTDMNKNTLSSSNETGTFKKLIASDGSVRFMGTVVSIIMGLVLGFILLLAFNMYLAPLKG